MGDHRFKFRLRHTNGAKMVVRAPMASAYLQRASPWSEDKKKSSGRYNLLLETLSVTIKALLCFCCLFLICDDSVVPIVAKHRKLIV